MFIKVLCCNKNKYKRSFNTINLENQINKSFNGSFFEIIKDIENYCKSKNIKILYISTKKKKVLLKAKSSLSTFKKFILKLENLNNFTNINSLEINKLSNSLYSYKVEVDFSKFHIKNIKAKKYESKKKNISLNLKAIVGKNILVNNKWLTLNEKIGFYQVKKIAVNYVVLESKNKKLVLKVHKYGKSAK